MRNPSENFKNRAETAREADTGIDTLFEPQIRQLGGVPAMRPHTGGKGSCG